MKKICPICGCRTLASINPNLLGPHNRFEATAYRCTVGSKSHYIICSVDNTRPNIIGMRPISTYPRKRVEIWMGNIRATTLYVTSDTIGTYFHFIDTMQVIKSFSQTMDVNQMIKISKSLQKLESFI